jgi:outer membrane immunogenic protein
MRSRITGVLIAAFSFALAQTSYAADMAVKAPPAPAVAPAYNWTGFYIGAVGTYGWGDAQHCDAGPLPPCSPTFPQTNPKGFEGGGTVGYNWQLTNWVLGFEGDWSAGKLKASSPSVPGFGCAAGGGTMCDTSITSIGTARGRVGYAIDRFLPYLTAGAAFSRLHADIGSGASQGTTEKTDFVWGGGVEVSLAPQWSAKIEYLNITKLGDFVYDTALACGAATPCYVQVKDINLVRLGVDYHFPPGH